MKRLLGAQHKGEVGVGEEACAAEGGDEEAGGRCLANERMSKKPRIGVDSEVEAPKVAVAAASSSSSQTVRRETPSASPHAVQTSASKL